VQKLQINWALLIGDLAPIRQRDSNANTQGMTILSTSDYVAIARQAAISVGIPPGYFVRQIYVESGFNPYAHSPAGAVGIAQFLPSTAAAMGVNPYDPVSALYGAARYMARLSNSFGGDYAKALAGYNAGSAAVNNAIATGGANWLAYMPLETQNYVRKIMG
jgi:soluble lytic murein transglycosylase-like protein